MCITAIVLVFHDSGVFPAILFNSHIAIEEKDFFLCLVSWIIGDVECSGLERQRFGKRQ
jgi:hypothetical protein